VSRKYIVVDMDDCELFIVAEKKGNEYKFFAGGLCYEEAKRFAAHLNKDKPPAPRRVHSTRR